MNSSMNYLQVEILSTSKHSSESEPFEKIPARSERKQVRSFSLKKQRTSFSVKYWCSSAVLSFSWSQITTRSLANHEEHHIISPSGPHRPNGGGQGFQLRKRGKPAFRVLSASTVVIICSGPLERSVHRFFVCALYQSFFCIVLRSSESRE
jgi:hypothetical protein